MCLDKWLRVPFQNDKWKGTLNHPPPPTERPENVGFQRGSSVSPCLSLEKHLLNIESNMKTWKLSERGGHSWCRPTLGAHQWTSTFPPNGGRKKKTKKWSAVSGDLASNKLAAGLAVVKRMWGWWWWWWRGGGEGGGGGGWGGEGEGGRGCDWGLDCVK